MPLNHSVAVQCVSKMFGAPQLAVHRCIVDIPSDWPADVDTVDHESPTTTSSAGLMSLKR
jgi:hypothetical protein